MPPLPGKPSDRVQRRSNIFSDNPEIDVFIQNSRKMALIRLETTWLLSEAYCYFGVNDLDVYLFVVSVTQEIIEALKLVENGKIVEIPVAKKMIALFNQD